MSRKVRQVCLWLVLGAVCVMAGMTTSPALAAQADKVLVVNVSGAMAQYDPADSLRALLPSHGRSAVPAAEAGAFLATPEGEPLQGCKSVDCMSVLGKGVGADLVITLRLSQMGGGGSVMLIAIDPRRASIVGRSSAPALSWDKIGVSMAVEKALASLASDLDAAAEAEEAPPVKKIALVPAGPAAPATIVPQTPSADAAAGAGAGEQTEAMPEEVPLEEAPAAVPPATPPVPETPVEPVPEVAVEPLPEELPPEPAPEEDDSSATRLKIKGELTTIGPLGIVVPNNRAGIALGYRQIYAIHYIYISPALDMHFFDDDFAFGFEIPINLEIFNGRFDASDLQGGETIGFGNAGNIRTEDWDEWHDYFRVIRYIRYGQKEDKFYLNINRDMANTMGHGFLLRRYLPNHELSCYRVSMAMDAYGDYVGFQLYTNDITSYKVNGLLLFVKPFAFIDNLVARSFSLGISTVFDRQAPIYLDLGDVSSHNRLISLYDGYVLGQDVDIEMKVMRNDHVDGKVYGDFAWLMPFKGPDPSSQERDILDTQYNGGWQNTDFDGGWGTTLGTLWRFNMGTDLVHAMRLRAEYRLFTDNYQPSYFDTFYEIQKYQFISETYGSVNKSASQDVSRNIIPSKYYDVFTRDEGTLRHGGMLEFTYSMVDYFGFTLAYEGATGDNQNKFLAHIEVPALSWLRLSATYYKWNFSSIEGMFDLTQSNAVLITAARIHPLPLLYFNLGLRKAIQPSSVYIGQMDSAYGVYMDIEFSWEWGIKGEDDE